MNQSDPSGLCNSQGNGNAWDLVNPWSSNNPIRCSAQKNPNSGGVHFVQEADPFYGAVAGYSGCRNSNYSVYTCANMNFNPAAVGLTAYSSCRNNMGASAFDCAGYTVDPLDWAFQGYSSEIQATESGCDFWTSLGYGAEGVVGVGSTELLALGGAGAVGGLAGGAADEGADSITGFTQHRLEQALGRDGGVGVSDSAMADAVENPVEVEGQPGGKIKYVGTNATVVLNSDGEVVTTWSNNSAGWRNTP